MRFTIRAVGAPLLAAALLSLAGCSSGAGGGGGSTPEATFETFKSSMKNKDYKTAFSQVTPETQDMMVGTMVMVAGMAAAFDPNNSADMQKILDKHGVGKIDPMHPPAGNDPMAAMKQLSANVKDKPGCIAEIMEFMEKGDSKKGVSGGPNFDELSSATLVDLKTDGNKATGIIKTKKGGEGKSQPASFKKVGDVWFIDMTDMMPGKPDRTENIKNIENLTPN